MRSGGFSSDRMGRGDVAGGGYAMGMGLGPYLHSSLCDLLILVGDMCLGKLVLAVL